MFGDSKVNHFPKWLKNQKSWGPIPSPRSRMISWVCNNDRFIYYYGGAMEVEETIPLLHCFDTGMKTKIENRN